MCSLYLIILHCKQLGSSLGFLCTSITFPPWYSSLNTVFLWLKQPWMWLMLLQLKAKNETQDKSTRDERASKMFERDCQLMGLTWLLARNKTEYIPTVSAVLRAIMYSTHPPVHESKCSPDQENMPLAVDSLQFGKAQSSSSSRLTSSSSLWSGLRFHVLPLMILVSLFG